MRRIGLQLIEEKKAQIAREMSEGKSGGVERKDVQGRDLLTLLMKANMATDIPDNQRLSDEDVLARESSRTIMENHLLTLLHRGSDVRTCTLC